MIPLLRIPLIAFGAATLLASVEGCSAESIDPVAGGATVSRLQSAELDALVEQMHGSHLSLRYRGVRQVLLVDPGDRDREPVQVEYTETVGCDGAGRFAIETRMTHADPHLAEDFELGQLGRQGYVFRHRDFAVRDLEAFRENYSIQQLGRERVAGILCVVLGIERVDGLGVHHEVHIDSATGLLLRMEQRDQRGTLLSRVSYDSMELGADLTDLQLDDHRLPRRVLEVGDGAEALALELGFEARLPEPPPGYRLLEASTLASLAGNRDWLKLTYSDGVESLVLLQSAPLPGDEPIASEVSVTRGGGATTLIQGVLERTELVVVGRVEREVLLSWLQSTF